MTALPEEEGEPAELLQGSCLILASAISSPNVREHIPSSSHHPITKKKKSST